MCPIDQSLLDEHATMLLQNGPFPSFYLSRKETTMKRLATLTTGLILGSPTLAMAAEHSASYRGIGYIYFTFIAGILIYGVHDAFGKTAMYVATPIILGWCYWMLPPT